MPAKTKAELKKEKKPKKTLTSLYKKASKAMQDHYRSIPVICYGCDSNLSSVLHHHSHWGQSVALRFEKSNLVPLCTSCHFAFHQGNFKIKHNYEMRMRSVYGQDWEDRLLIIEQNHPHQTDKEKRERLAGLITNFKNGIDLD
jgi:hypothetical protein